MKIKLIATSDIHGYVSGHRYSNKEAVNQGVSRLVQQIEAEHDEHTLLIDNGDILQGSPMNYYHSLYEADSMHPMAKVLNYLQYDYYNLGNHDFNFGLDMLAQYQNDVNAICLSGNVLLHGKPIAPAYQIHDFGAVKIALIGAVTHFVPHWEKPEHIENMIFLDAYQFIKDTVMLIKNTQQVDGIVVVYHGGFENDLNTGEPTETHTGENQAYQICGVDGIDVLISGHQHRSIGQYVNGVYVTQTAHQASEAVCIEWDLDSRQIDSRFIYANQDEDVKTMQLIAQLEDKTQSWLDQPLGRLEQGDLLIHDAFAARFHKHPLVSFLNQVQFYFTNADCSAVALFNDAVGFSQEITMRDLVSTYVYPNTIVVLKMSKKQLLAYLEKCAEYFTVSNGVVGVSSSFSEPKPQHYNYDMVDGISYVIHADREVGHRIDSVLFKGKELLDDQFVSVAMSNYRASGGGDFTMVYECERIKEITMDMVECIAEYIRSHPVLKIQHIENIQVVGGKS